MSSRKERRAALLLRVRRQQEKAARWAFQQTCALTDSAEQRIAELGKLLAARNEDVRRGLAAGEPTPSLSYRADASRLLAAISQRRAELLRHELLARRARADLTEAMTRRKAAEALRDKLARRVRTGQSEPAGQPAGVGSDGA